MLLHTTHSNSCQYPLINYLTSGSKWDRFCRNSQRFTFGIFTFISRNVVDSLIRTFAFYVKWATPTFACPNSIRCGVLIKTEIFALEFEGLTVLWNNMYLLILFENWSYCFFRVSALSSKLNNFQNFNYRLSFFRSIYMNCFVSP